MKNHLLRFGIGLAGFLILFAGSASAVHYRVTIDCNHTSMRNTDTGNRITVSFLDANRIVIRNVSRTGIRNCSANEAGFSINTDRIVRYIEFSTNGNDAFYIDEWRLFVESRLVKREGRDNGKGWCLSTDPRDAVGPWKGYVTGGCRTRIRFPVAGGVVVPSRSVYRVAIDCNHTSIRNTDTGNRITVSFLDANRNLIRNVSRNGVRNCSGADAGFSINTNRAVRYVTFSTNGNDAFYIDEWRLYKGNEMIKHEGRDNGKGWCLSTDPRDGFGAWRGWVTGGCRTSIRFPVAGGTVVPDTSTYRLSIDCNHTSISNTDTGNRITVSFLDANRGLIRNVSKNGIRNCSGGDAVYSINTNRRVRYVSFRTNGNDAFYIDEWRLFRGNSLIKHQGRDNGKGWCLSTDPRDAVGAWRGWVTGGCRKSIRFPI